MTKTVFGMPGAGDKSTGGDAVAPGGAPGATGGKGLPQKSAKETPQTSAPEKVVEKPAVIEAPTSEKKPSKAPMAIPTTGKPVLKKPAGGKTVFGMPAMKLPIQPGAVAQQQQERSSAPPVAAAKPSAPAKRSTPVGLKAPDSLRGLGKAEKGTMLGIGGSGASAEQKPEEPSTEPARGSSSPASSDGPMHTQEALATAPENTPAPVAQEPADVATPVSEPVVESVSARKGAQQPPTWLLVILISIIVILIAMAGYFVFDWVKPS